MKKIYEKPRLYAETFQMAEHIATGCGQVSGVSPTYGGFGDGCGFRVNGGSQIAYQRADVCIGWYDPIVGPISADTDWCYNTFEDPNAMFSS